MARWSPLGHRFTLAACGFFQPILSVWIFSETITASASSGRFWMLAVSEPRFVLALVVPDGLPRQHLTTRDRAFSRVVTP